MKKFLSAVILILMTGFLALGAGSGYLYTMQHESFVVADVPTTTTMEKYQVITAGAGMSVSSDTGAHTVTLACTGGPGTPDGSAAAPSFSFTNDPDTGFYSVSSNDIGVSTGGTKRGDFTSAGWVGNVTGNVTGNLVGIASGMHGTTVADNGGGTAAASTLTTPTANTELYTCNDTDGCAVTLGETSVADGQTLRIVNASSNNVTLADTSGVSETTGAITLGQYDSASYVYIGDRWVETGASNN